MLFLLAALATSAFAQDFEEHRRELLGVCGIYKAAFPYGHAEADLSKPLFDYLPETTHPTMEVELSTEDFIMELYRPQRAFCESQSETVNALVDQLMSGEEVSAINRELVDISLFEMAVVYDEKVMESRGYEDETRYADSEEGRYVDSEEERYYGYERRNLSEANRVFFMCLGAFVLMVIALGVVDQAHGDARRALAATASDVISSDSPASLQRLLSETQGAPRRALSEEVRVTLKSVLTACVDDVPSFVCTLSTSVLTHTLVSEICGGFGVMSCHVSVAHLEGLMN